MKYATKDLQYCVVYGYRIDLYTMAMEYIMSLEVQDGRCGTLKDPAHYEEIAVRASKSIPQIKRDFTATFENGETYLRAATGRFQQPSYHARKILELLDLYEPVVLDKILEYAIKVDKLEIKDIKQLIRNNFFEIMVAGQMSTTTVVNNEAEDLLRNCDYYEESKEVTPI